MRSQNTSRLALAIALIALCLLAGIGIAVAVYTSTRPTGINNGGDFGAQVFGWGGGEQLIYGLPEGTGTPVAVQIGDDGHLLTDSPIANIVDLLPILGTNVFTVSSSITNTRVFTAVAGHGLTMTDTLFFRDSTDELYQQVGIVSIATDVITVDTPLDRAWDGTHPHGLTDMAVDGSTTPQIFHVTLSSSIAIHVTRIIVHIEDNSAMDDGKFGALSALTNGVVVRVYRVATGKYETIINAKTNGEWAQRAYDVSYADNAPSGTYGFRVRRAFGGEDKAGSAILLEPGDAFQVVVQDDLTDLLGFGLAVQGHIAH